MNPKIAWNEDLMMLMASGSPGSAWAYQLTRLPQASGMVRRTTASQAAEQAVEAAETDVPTAPAPAKNWLRNAFQRLSQWSWQQEMKRREAYLAQAQNIFDLEARMRRLDHDMLSRGEALR